LVWQFLDFFTISYRFYRLVDLNRGVLIFYRKASGKIQILAIGSLAGLTGKPIGADQISARGAHQRRGASEGKFQELTAVMEVAGVEEERDYGVAEPTQITPAQVRESTLEGSNVLQRV
jgi:hypothetical protein